MLNPQAIGPNQEQFEYFKDRTRKATRRCGYDYRDFDGTLFSCIRPTLAACVAARDEWLQARQDKQPQNPEKQQQAPGGHNMARCHICGKMVDPEWHDHADDPSLED